MKVILLDRLTYVAHLYDNDERNVRNILCFSGQINVKQYALKGKGFLL